MEKYKFRKSLHEPELSGKYSLQLCNQLLLEQAVCCFIKKHQMDAMTEGHNIISGQFVVEKQRFDIETEDACIEIKTFIPPSNKGQGYIQESLWQSIKQIVGYGNSLPRDKRKILFVVGQKGISKAIGKLTNQEMLKSLQKAVGMGMELWVAEVDLKPGDSIEFLWYKNVTNDIQELK